MALFFAHHPAVLFLKITADSTENDAEKQPVSYSSPLVVHVIDPSNFSLIPPHAVYFLPTERRGFARHRFTALPFRYQGPIPMRYTQGATLFVMTLLACAAMCALLLAEVV